MSPQLPPLPPAPGTFLMNLSGREGRLLGTLGVEECLAGGLPLDFGNTGAIFQANDDWRQHRPCLLRSCFPPGPTWKRRIWGLQRTLHRAKPTPRDSMNKCMAAPSIYQVPGASCTWCWVMEALSGRKCHPHLTGRETKGTMSHGNLPKFTHR